MRATWLARWRGWRDDRAVRRRPIADDLWKRTLGRYKFLRRKDPRHQAELRRLTSLFLDRKEFTAIGEQRLSNDVVVAIAAQACLPILHLGLDRYDDFVGIVVHPDQALARRSVQDDDGVVHEYDELLAGEAVQGGPVMLSWRDVRAGGSALGQGYNVVIHEFAHVLDLADGRCDGIPLLPPDIAVAQWQSILNDEFARLTEQLRGAQPTVLDPYAAEGIEEFFAVASEAFFVSPQAMQGQHPALYGLFSRYYGQDPATEPIG